MNKMVIEFRNEQRIEIQSKNRRTQLLTNFINDMSYSQNTAIIKTQLLRIAEHSYRPGREVKDESGWHVVYNNKINNISYS